MVSATFNWIFCYFQPKASTLICPLNYIFCHVLFACFVASASNLASLLIPYWLPFFLVTVHSGIKWISSFAYWLYDLQMWSDNHLLAGSFSQLLGPFLAFLDGQPHSNANKEAGFSRIFFGSGNILFVLLRGIWPTHWLKLKQIT
jgi:hypothetical protein